MKKTMYGFLLKATLCFILATIIITSGFIPASAAGGVSKTSAIKDKAVISENLEYLYKAYPGEKQRVMIWLKDIDTTAAVRAAFKSVPDYADRLIYLTDTVRLSEEENQELSSYISTKRAAMKSCYQEYTQDFSGKCLSSDDIIYSSQYTPIIIAELTQEKAIELSQNKQVTSIEYYCDNVIISDDTINVSGEENKSLLTPPEYYSISSQISYINADDVWSVYSDTGFGVNIGILDVGLPDSGMGIAFTPHYTNEYVNDHASKVLEIAYSVATSANFYCTSYITVFDPTPTLISEMEWLLSCDVDVINISMILADDMNGNDDGFNTYGTISKYLDSLIYSYDVSIVMAAGNFGSTGIVSGGMAYNAVTVGGYDRYSGQIESLSSYYNNSVYAYKPDICAPSFFEFYLSGGYGNGTSAAAPMVTGTIALIMSYRGSLRVNPTGIKSILTSSVSLSTSHHYDTRLTLSSYKQYGAGIVDAYRAVTSAANYRYTTNWMYANATTVDYYDYFSYGNTVRISLVFEKIDFGQYGEDVSLADLDIRIYYSDGNNQLVGYSATLNNNVEIVEFTPIGTGTYKIVIANYEPATGDIDYPSIYSFSWVYS